MTPDRIAMVMPYKQFVRKAVAEGFEVISTWDPGRQTPEYLDEVARFSAELVLTDFADGEALARLVVEAAGRYGARQVVHLGSEDTQLPVCEHAYPLGLTPNPPQALRHVNDKAATRRLLRERGLSPVRCVELDAPDEVPRALDGFDPPVVVKPTRLDGSRGVRLVRDRHDLAAWTADLAGYGYTGPVLVEEYLSGPEYSVEALTAHGRHHIIGVTAKTLAPPPGFVEVGHTHPAPLPLARAHDVTALVSAFLEASGYRFGPSHTEVIVTERGPRIVESQARIGGDRIPLLIELSSGFDIEAAVFGALRGKPVEPPAPTRLGCVMFFDFGAGRLTALDGLDRVGDLPFVHALTVKHSPGDVLPAVVDSGSRHGYVVVDADSPRQADERFALVRDLLHAEIEPDHSRTQHHGGR